LTCNEVTDEARGDGSESRGRNTLSSVSGGDTLLPPPLVICSNLKKKCIEIIIITS